MIKGRISQYAKDKFHSLYFRLIWVIVVGALIASGCYIIARFVSNYYINNYYTDENNKVEREERYIDENTVELYNKGDFDTDYSVLKFDYIPQKCLTAFKCVHLLAGEKLIVDLKD